MVTEAEAAFGTVTPMINNAAANTSRRGKQKDRTRTGTCIFSVLRSSKDAYQYHDRAFQLSSLGLERDCGPKKACREKSLYAPSLPKSIAESESGGIGESDLVEEVRVSGTVLTRALTAVPGPGLVEQIVHDAEQFEAMAAYLEFVGCREISVGHCGDVVVVDVAALEEGCVVGAGTGQTLGRGYVERAAIVAQLKVEIPFRNAP